MEKIERMRTLIRAMKWAGINIEVAENATLDEMKMAIMLAGNDKYAVFAMEIANGKQSNRSVF